MSSNLFWPIYRNLENELKELSNFVYINQKQLNVYSVKIADLILRTVAEIENLLKELCHKEGIKFLDKNRRKRKVVNFHEYYEKIEEKYLLSNKYVAAIYDGFSEDLFYSSKILPFEKLNEIQHKKKILIHKWYNAYNMIKHDRTKNFKHANLENLITALAALFLLNIYHQNKDFNSIDHQNIDDIKTTIKEFSDVFRIDIGIDISTASHINSNQGDFFDPILFHQETAPHCTYLIQFNQRAKTAKDRINDFREIIEANILYYNKEQNITTPKHENHTPHKHWSECNFIVKLNKTN